MGLKLHFHPLSAYSRRVLIALIGKQIPCEKVFVDTVAGKHRNLRIRRLICTAAQRPWKRVLVQ